MPTSAANPETYIIQSRDAHSPAVRTPEDGRKSIQEEPGHAESNSGPDSTLAARENNTLSCHNVFMLKKREC